MRAVRSWSHLQKRLFSLLGVRALRRNKLGKATRYLLKAAGIDGGGADCHFLLGLIFFRSGNLGAAAGHFKTACCLCPSPLMIRALPFEVYLFLTGYWETLHAQLPILTSAFSPTSNGTLISSSYPSPIGFELFLPGEGMRSLDERPPITEKEIKDLDLDDLIRAFFNDGP